MPFDSGQTPHRRFNPLTGEWVLVSPHRSKRPWQGQQENGQVEERPKHDPVCYLCPRNSRANGDVNPDYKSTFVFLNDFPAILPVAHEVSPSSGLRAEPVSGECRVVCFSPRHDLSLAEMPVEGIKSVVKVWIDQAAELGKRYKWVQHFENKGAVMGCSNPHPHGQIWAGDWLPSIPAREDACQRNWEGNNLLLDCLDDELEDGTRVVAENEHWVFLVPFWATWPFEGLLLPRRHVTRITDLASDEATSLAEILKELLVRYDNLFESSFPYSMGWHGAPFGEGDWSHWQLHAHFYPPLLRSASVKKFMVGYEMLAEAQRDITPEQAAEMLRSVSDVHYRQ